MKDLGAVLIYSCQGARFAPLSKFTHCGGNGLRVPPVPIPNTEVKPQHADGTWLETARESRSLPHFIFLSSSMAEHSAVNRRVVGSSPTWGANDSLSFMLSEFFVYRKPHARRGVQKSL